jgi:hypothetical protein
MKKSILIAILAFAMAITFNACNNSMSNSTTVAQKTVEKEVYTCSMHPEVRSDKPGDCPKCGMNLVKMEVSDTTKVNVQPDTTMKMK